MKQHIEGFGSNYTSPKDTVGLYIYTSTHKKTGYLFCFTLHNVINFSLHYKKI